MSPVTSRRIAMWSGPRNISTTMMRAFENRSDTAVIDEPLYGHYLRETGLVHPMGELVLAAQPDPWPMVAQRLISDQPAEIFFQKHMTHHLVGIDDLEWLAALDHVFLIRNPALMTASFAKKMPNVCAEDLGLADERALYDQVTALKGTPPPIIDAQDVLRNPEGMLKALCDALSIRFDGEMLNWPPGPRDSDGVWAPHWYDAVTRSTGFGAPAPEIPVLDGSLRSVAEACRPDYDALYAQRLTIKS